MAYFFCYMTLQILDWWTLLETPTHVFWPKNLCVQMCDARFHVSQTWYYLPKCTMPSCYAFINLSKGDSQCKIFIRIDATDQPVCNSVLLMWLFITEDNLIKVFWEAQSKSKDYLQIVSRRNKKLEYIASNRGQTYALVLIWILHSHLHERMACIWSKRRNRANLPWS
jgi:hypothetical protein